MISSRNRTALRALALSFLVVLSAGVLYAPAVSQAPTAEEVRKSMSIPSTASERGQKDGIGFASTAVQMERAWDLAGLPPFVEKLGPVVSAPAAGVICPHDDYLYAARVYRQVLSSVTARTAIVVGVFHGFRKFGVRDVLVFDDYETWRTPDGPVAISPLRAELLARLPKADVAVNRVAHDNEHSVEAIAYWLKHQRRDIEIVPVLVPAAKWERLREISGDFGTALAEVMKARGWQLGRDVSIVISADAIHYGADFSETPFGEGGVAAYQKAVERDVAQLRGPLAGPISEEKLRQFYSTCVDPAEPSKYRMTWCGRFSIPAGLSLLSSAARALGMQVPVGHPICYATSVGSPEIPARDTGLGTTAPSNLYHFVGYPAVVFTALPGP